MCGIIIYPNVFNMVIDVKLISQGFYEVLEKERLVHPTFWIYMVTYSENGII